MCRTYGSWNAPGVHFQYKSLIQNQNSELVKSHAGRAKRSREGMRVDAGNPKVAWVPALNDTKKLVSSTATGLWADGLIGLWADGLWISLGHSISCLKGTVADKTFMTHGK